jgi:exodeoxyribonuclease III
MSEPSFRLATWNINSIRMRLPRLLDWLATWQPDVVCLQEIKVTDDKFPLVELQDAGYHPLFFGQKSYNGMAILSRQAATSQQYNLPDDPPDADRRLLAAQIGNLQIINVYAPNGSEVGCEKYHFKLDWYARLSQFITSTFQPNQPLILCGDFNVAPLDHDVWDVQLWQDKIIFSTPEKTAFQQLLDWGFCDLFRHCHPMATGIYTLWDYRAGSFHRNWGLRIDHILTTATLTSQVLDIQIDREARKGVKPSDHAPVIATFQWKS